MIGFRSPLAAIALAALSACASPHFVDKGKGEDEKLEFNPQVVFQVHDAFNAAPPDCVAILPFTIKAGSKISPEDTAKVRLSLYAHLATQSKRSVRLERIDHALVEVKGDRKALGEKIKCAAVIEGVTTEYDSSFYALYSRVAAGIDLKMVRTADGSLLWEAHHTAVSHGGSLPIDPVSAAAGVVDAASNIRDEQILRVTDDLARRLISTIPDNIVVALDDPADELPKPAQPAASADDLAVGEKLLADGDNAGALAAADRAIAADPNRSAAWFLKGRVLILDKDFDQAEPAVLRAVALDHGNAKYLNALGAVNAEKGTTDRALAAYRMAINAEPADGFAWYNSAIIHFNAGNPPEAADAFYAAALAYLKTGNYAKAERALGDLRDLEKAGIPVQARIKTIEEALSDTTRRKT